MLSPTHLVLGHISCIPLPKCTGQSRQPRQKVYYCLYINGTKKQSMPVCTPLEIPRSSPEQLIHLGNRYTRTTHRGGQSCIFTATVSGNIFEPLAYVGSIFIQNGRFYLNYFRFGYYLKYCSLELMRNLIIG